MGYYVDIRKWKKRETIPLIFEIENWLWKSDFGTFWQLWATFADKNTIIYFEQPLIPTQ